MKKEILFGTLFIVFCLVLTSFKAVVIFMTITFIFLIPGIPFSNKYCNNLACINKIYFSIIIGFPISTFLCIFIAVFFGLNPIIFVVAIILFSLIFYKEIFKYFKQRWNTISASWHYYLILISIIFMLTLSFSNFGKITNDGLMFKDLYATDLLHHMSVFRYLPNGIPPANPYFEGVDWHYYWITHVFPAVVYIASGYQVEPKEILFLFLCLNILIFMNILFTYLSNFRFKYHNVLIVLIISILAYGYNDLYLLFKIGVEALPGNIKHNFGLSYFISDSYGGSFTGYSHGWFRNFLVEPHSTLALAIVLLYVTLRINNGCKNLRINLFMGTLLGFVFAYDAFIGAIIISWTLADIVISRINLKEKVNEIICGGFIVLPITIILLSLWYLKILAPGGSGLIFKPYTKMLVLSPAYFIIDFGPLFVFSVIGIFLLKNENTFFAQNIPLAKLFFICLIYMFFINLSDIGTTQMFRKAGMVIRIVMIFLTGYCLENMYKFKFKNTFVISASFILVALPTPFLDIFNLGIIDQKESTTFIRGEDMEACNWIKLNLPKKAIVQDFPGGYTPIVAFGERGVALGDWEHAKSSGVSLSKIQERFNKIKNVYSNPDPVIAFKVSEELNIDYLYVNKRCAETFPAGVKKFEKSDMFENIYNKDGVYVFKVNEKNMENGGLK